MTLRTAAFAFWFCFVLGGAALAQTVALPNDGDEYSQLVARADAEDATLDFHALRLAYLKSAARKRAGASEDQARRDLFDAVKTDDTQRVRDLAAKLLSLDYTDLYGQKFLRQSCAVLKDDACAQKAHFAEFGLLSSIMRSGDGKTCSTGWEALQVKEEYFVLAMLDTKVKQQALVSHCDLMTVVDKNGQEASYFFRIDVMMQDEESMFK